MKKFLPIILMATLVTFATQSKATIRRVGYFGTATAIDYSDLQSAHDAAAAGDTIYLYPGTWNVTLSKKLTIMGYGYFLTGSGANTGLQTITTSLFVNISFAQGSDNSVLDGLDNLAPDLSGMQGNVSTGIIIKHCRITSGYNLTYAPMTNWQITQCYFDGTNINLPGAGAVLNLKVSNCIFAAVYTYDGDRTGSTGQFTNCVFIDGYVNFGNASYLIKNSILNHSYKYSGISNVVFQNNIFNSDNGDTTGTPSTNKNVSFGTVSVFATSTSTDNQFSLSTSSPAKAAGVGGIDCGIFGGTAPYVLSGLPAVPTFYKLTAPSSTTSTNPYTITFSVQSR